MEKQLKITISGSAASGKSRLTLLIKNFLYDQGFNIKFIPTFDHPSESKFDREIGKNLDGAIKSIKDTVIISMEQVQTTKEK